jgi:hypothetical protein
MNSYEKGKTMTGTDELVMRITHSMHMISFNIKTTEILVALLIILDNNFPL